jgi:hypothetical protein
VKQAKGQYAEPANRSSSLVKDITSAKNGAISESRLNRGIELTMESKGFGMVGAAGIEPATLGLEIL